MGIREWFTRGGAHRVDRRLRHWRQLWSKAETAEGRGEIAALQAELDSIGLPEEEIEIEREMLQALIDRHAVAASIRESGLPNIETGHRVVRGEPCHYSEPVSMPDEPAQPSGRLLLTATRAIFVGSGKTLNMPWHTIGTAFHTERDVLLVRNGREHAHRFRCNTYGDALRAIVIGREILSRNGRRG